MPSRPRTQESTLVGPLSLLFAFTGLATACDGRESTTPPRQDPPASAPAQSTPAEASTPTVFEVDRSSLAAVIAGPQRSDAHRARDAYRHPAETLGFFGVDDTATVVELWPGGGWYTEILAPWLQRDGKLIVTNFDPDGDPEAFTTKLAKRLNDKLAANPEVYDRVEVATVRDGEAIVLAPPGSVDVVLTFRNSHNWFRDGQEVPIYTAAFEALKPGGTFGVVQHRAPEGADPKASAPRGYVPEKTLIETCEKIGFRLAEKSEINANPADTKDYEAGVWALPPRLQGPKEEHDAMRAIGESDRMTLKFVKPE